MPPKPDRGPRSTVQRYLSKRQLVRHGDAIELALRKKRRAWGLQGWSIQGRGDRLRVVAKVPYRRVSPEAAVEPLALSRNLSLKVAVESTFVQSVGKTTRGGAGRHSSQDALLAPGSVIEVSSGGRSRCGVATVLTLDDDPFLLTCGHTFNSGNGRVFLPGSSAPIATLTQNLLDERVPVDAAVCELSALGRSLLEASSDADTWFRTIRSPDSLDNGKDAEFWPTSESEPDPIDVRIASFSACFEPLFGPGGPRCRFIEVRLPATEGDSGSVLALRGEYYGLCSGTAGASSYFTSISDVVQALGKHFTRVSLWQPN